MTEGKKVVIDCDPGIDDCFALLLCMKHLDVAGIVAVGGNTDLQYTERNARLITELAGRPEIPVYAGYNLPLGRKVVRATDVHGNSGLGDVFVQEPIKKLESRHGVDYLIDTFMNRDDVTLITLGPMTNVAQALLKEPRLATRIPGILSMAGSAFVGNDTAVAEFNISGDPEAAQIVLQSGIPIRMVGLNVLRQNRFTEKEVEQIRQCGGPVAEFAAELLSFAIRRYGYSNLCDASAVSWMIDPSIITNSVSVHMEVETKGELTRGMTVCDWRAFLSAAPKEDLAHERQISHEEMGAKEGALNVELAMEMDSERMKQLLLDTIRSYGK